MDHTRVISCSVGACFFAAMLLGAVRLSGEEPPRHVPEEVQAKESEARFGARWWENFWFRLERFDRRNDTAYYRAAKPKIITGREAFDLFREENGYPIFGNKKIDALVEKTSNHEQSIALYWRLPSKPSHPEALLYMPFFKEDHGIFDAVGIGSFLGTSSIKSERATSPPAKPANSPGHIEALPSKLPPDYVLLLSVPACANTPGVRARIEQVMATTASEIPVYSDLIANHSALFPEFAPVRGGPLLVYFKDRVVRDLQYGSSSLPQVKHFFARNDLSAEEVPRAKHWEEIEDRETLLRTLSVMEFHVATDFGGVDLRGANFDKTVISGADFSNANLTKTSFKGAYIYNSVFDGARVDGAMFEGAVWLNSRCPDGKRSDDKTRSCRVGDRALPGRRTGTKQ